MCIGFQPRDEIAVPPHPSGLIKGHDKKRMPSTLVDGLIQKCRKFVNRPSRGALNNRCNNHTDGGYSAKRAAMMSVCCSPGSVHPAYSWPCLSQSPNLLLCYLIP